MYGCGPGFLGWFQDNKNAEARSTNLYYPFLSKGEWEIAAFLSRSGLSMKLIDEFLSLSLVSHLNYLEYHETDITPDYRAETFLSLCADLTWAG